MNQVNKANRVMGPMRRSYTYLDKKSFCYLFNTLVRPHLEYCISIWYSGTHLIKQNKELIENVLGRASELRLEISNFSYPYRLCAIDIPSIKYCRVRFDTSSQSSSWSR